MKKHLKYFFGIIFSILFCLGVITTEFSGNVSGAMDVPLPVMILQIPFLVALILMAMELFADCDFKGYQGLHAAHTILGMIAVATSIHHFYPMVVTDHANGLPGYRFLKSEGWWTLIFALSTLGAFFALWVPMQIIRYFFFPEEESDSAEGLSVAQAQAIRPKPALSKADMTEAKRKYILKAAGMTETELQTQLAEALKNEWYEKAEVIRKALERFR